jgi:hypothetical protein
MTTLAQPAWQIPYAMGPAEAVAKRAVMAAMVWESFILASGCLDGKVVVLIEEF